MPTIDALMVNGCVAVNAVTLVAAASLAVAVLFRVVAVPVGYVRRVVLPTIDASMVSGYAVANAETPVAVAIRAKATRTVDLWSTIAAPPTVR